MIPTAWDIAFGLVALLMPLIEAATILTSGSFMVSDGHIRSREETWWGKQ
ncbi:MAG: hypothetical protein HZA46_24160 [Planctomycetales bacterium]|nr:hypothetical protein [Planctomycetales bacterium]